MSYFDNPEDECDGCGGLCPLVVLFIVVIIGAIFLFTHIEKLDNVNPSVTAINVVTEVEAP